MIVGFYRIEKRLAWVLDKLLWSICKWNRTLNESLAQTVSKIALECQPHRLRTVHC